MELWDVFRRFIISRRHSTLGGDRGTDGCCQPIAIKQGKDCMKERLNASSSGVCRTGEYGNVHSEAPEAGTGKSIKKGEDRRVMADMKTRRMAGEEQQVVGGKEMAFSIGRLDSGTTVQGK